MKNFVTIRSKKFTFLSSPLALLVLGACGGGGSISTGPSGGSFVGSSSSTVGGNVVKGPLSNALVGLDYDGDGVVDSATVRTGVDGSYSLTTTNTTYTVIAVADETTIDTSSGTVLSGITLKAPAGTSVVTPTTTLIEEAGITKEQVAEVLGLPDGVDPLSFNPYADGVDAADALAVEKASQQIMSVVNAFAGAAEGSGATEAEAFEAALNSVVEVVKTKATKLSDASASAADKTLDLTNASDLALVKAEVAAKVAAETSADTTAFDALADDTVTAVKNVNDKIATVDDLSSAEAKNTFSTTQVLADQVKAAAEAEVASAGSGSIDFTDATKVETAAANKAPTDIALSKTAIAEDASSLVIGTLTTTDSDQTSGVIHTYKIAELSGTDYAAFSINAATGELSFKAQPDFETKSNYSITILSTDEGGKTFSKSFTISVTDANDAPTVANAISDQTIAEDSALSFQFASDVFSDVDAGDSLTYAATLADGSTLPSWLSFDASSRTFSGTPSNGDVGAIDVKVTATDGSSAPATDTFTLTVTNTNDAPTVANAISDQTIAEDSALSFQFASDVFSDVDAGDSLTYAATLADGSTLPSWLSFDASSRTFSGTPSNGDVGAIDVKVTATDASGAVDTQSFNITVSNVNDAPTITSTQLTSVTEGQAYSYTFAASDVDVGDNVTLAAPTKPSWLSFDASTGVLSGTPDNAEVGDHAVVLTATDDSSATATDTFTLTVTNTNDAPTVANAISDQTIAGDSALSFQFASDVFSDVDAGDSLTYTATLADGSTLPSWLSFDASSRTFSGTPSNGDVGAIDVKVTATDDSSATATDTFTLTVTITAGGNVVKGPLSNALVGLDYDGDGVVDSSTVRTGADGSYSLTTTNSTYTVIAVADETTIDTSSGTVLSGITLKAPKGASVVTPTTTLIEEAGITKEQVAEVLGLPDGVDPLSFNPYATGVNAADALAVEKASQQIMSVVNAFAGAAEGSGATEAEAFNAALNSVVEVVKTKATKLSDANASAADKTLDLTKASDLALVKAEVAAKVAAETSANTTAFNALADDTVTAVKNVNDKIATVSDLSSDAAKNTFSITQVLADQVKTAAEAEVASAGSGSIDFTDATKVNTAAANKAPTDIALSTTAIAEDASSLVIGTLTTTDSDQTSGVIHTYKIAELSGTDYAAFSINAATGELSFKAQPDFETKSSYSITILSTDEEGKTYSKSFTISVTDANDAPTVANAISDQTIAEDSALSFQFASDVFSDVDAGDSLTYAATLADGSTLPSWLSFDASSRTFSGTPSNGDVGAIDVKVTATDGSSATATDTFTLTVKNKVPTPSNFNAKTLQNIYDGVDSFSLNADSERIYTLSSDTPNVAVAVSVERSSGTVEGLFAVAKHTHNSSEVSIGVLSHHELFRAALGRDPSIDDSARLVANFINEVAPANQLLNSDQPLRILSIGSNPYFSTRQTDGERYTYIDAVDSNEIEGRIHSEFNYEIDTLRADDRHLVVEDILGPQRDWATDYDVVILRPSYERKYIDMALDWAASTGGSLLFGFDAGSFSNNPSYVAPHPEFLDFLKNDLGIAIGEPGRLESDTTGLDDYSVTRINPFTTVNLRNYLGLTDGVPGTDASQPLQVTSEMNLVSVVTDQNGLKVGDVSWSSSNEAIVSNSGELNAAGNATLAATINGVDGNTYVVNTYIEAFPLLDENGNSLTQGLTFDIVGWDDDVSTNSDNELRNFNRVDQTYDDENNIFNLTEIGNSGDLLYSFVSADLWIDDTGSVSAKTSKTPSYSRNVKDEINTELGVSDQPIVAVVSGFIIANETGTHSIKLSSLDKQSELWIETEGGVVNKDVDKVTRDIRYRIEGR